MTETVPDTERWAAASVLLRALAAPVRLAIIDALGAGPRCVHELVDEVGSSQSLVSQHLRVLRGAAIVRGDRRGREIVYALTDDHVAHIVADAVQHAAEDPAEQAAHPATDPTERNQP